MSYSSQKVSLRYLRRWKPVGQYQGVYFINDLCMVHKSEKEIYVGRENSNIIEIYG